MALAAITKQGLGSITILVALLWGCLVAEQLTLRNAKAETYRALRGLNRVRVERQVQPASAPTHTPVPARSVVG